METTFYVQMPKDRVLAAVGNRPGMSYRIETMGGAACNLTLYTKKDTDWWEDYAERNGIEYELV